MQYSKNTHDFKVFYLFEDGSQVCFWKGWQSLPDERLFSFTNRDVQAECGKEGRIIGFKVVQLTEEENKIVNDGRVQLFVNRTVSFRLPDDGTITMEGMLKAVGYSDEGAVRRGNGWS